MSKPVVYLVREKNDNPMLRYSLRSVEQFFPHSRLVIAGHMPPFVQNAEHIDVEQIKIPQGDSRVRHHNTTTIMREVNERIGEDYVLMHDDMYFLTEMHDSPLYHGGHIDIWHDRWGRRRNTQHARGLRATREYMERLQWPHRNFYDLHTPLLVVREAMDEALSITEDEQKVPMFKRTLYGNLLGDYGIHLPHDVKWGYHGDREFTRLPFVSVDWRSWERKDVGGRLRAIFSEMCKYEAWLP